MESIELPKPPTAVNPWWRPVLYVASLPADLLWGCPAVLFIWLLWGTKLCWEREALTCQLKQGSWPNRTWYAPWGGTTLSPHAIFYNAGTVSDTDDWWPVQFHEHVHVEQGEAACFKAALIAFASLLAFGFASWPFALGVWIMGYPLMGIANWSTALLRGESPYRGSHHEESAYAQDELYEHQLYAKWRERAIEARKTRDSVKP